MITLIAIAWAVFIIPILCVCKMGSRIRESGDDAVRRRLK